MRKTDNLYSCIWTGIVQHRDRGLPPYPLTSHNLSSSSISSTNSGGASNPSTSLYGTSTWPIRLGPAPFKSQFSTQTLPPKPPGAGSTSSSGVSRSTHSKVPIITTPPLVSPLRKVNSVERLTTTSEYGEEFENLKTSGRGTLKRLKNFDATSSLQYDSKAFGSLDSLRDLVNGSREDLSPKSSDGTDLFLIIQYFILQVTNFTFHRFYSSVSYSTSQILVHQFSSSDFLIVEG